jgi:hypothetical protein
MHLFLCGLSKNIIKKSLPRNIKGSDEMIGFRNFGILCSEFDHVPTAYEICEKDKRLLYLGTVKDDKGNVYEDAFVPTFDPTRLFTIKGSERVDDNTFYLKTDRHDLKRDSLIVQTLYDIYNDEVYVGDVCDATSKTGEAWQDAYKSCLGSKSMYTKTEDGTRILISSSEDICYDILDYFGYRVVLKTPNQPDKNYAFFYGINAFYKWFDLAENAQEDQVVLHNLKPNYKDFLRYNECKEFEEYPKLVKKYPNCHSDEGFFKTR